MLEGKRPWLRLKRELRDKSVSRFTNWEVVCPTTPLEKRGGISIDREDPTEEEDSRLALLDRSSSSSSSKSSKSSSWSSKRSIWRRSRFLEDICWRTWINIREESALDEAAAPPPPPGAGWPEDEVAALEAEGEEEEAVAAWAE